MSGLALNFIPQPARAAAEMVRLVKPEGVVAAYVWDYAGKMQLMRHFWNAAAALDPLAYDLDEGRRFPLCQPDPLRELFQQAGLSGVEVRPIDIATDFRDFDDFWSPFLGGQGPAAGYAMSLSEEGRLALRERIRRGTALRAGRLDPPGGARLGGAGYAAIKWRIVYRKLQPADAASYRALRLASLQSSPDNFGSTYAEESKKPTLFFEALIEKGSQDSFMFGCVR